jgi:hypothetical protein
MVTSYELQVTSIRLFDLYRGNQVAIGRLKDEFSFCEFKMMCPILRCKDKKNRPIGELHFRIGMLTLDF